MSDVPGKSVPREVAEAPPDARFGKFVRTQMLGAGGMGDVWKAWDTELNRWVALKFLRGGDSDEILRFQREAQTAAQLSHPNIAAVFEVGRGHDRHYIAMQFVRGVTLETFPRNDRRRVVGLIRDAARALHYAHEHGVIHRDVKPAKLMVEGDRLYVMDFGLAKQQSVASSLSQSGMAVGTPMYMSPEQARGESGALDARTDVWGLAATLYELVAGRPPFRGKDLFETLTKVLEEEPRSTASMAGVDRDLDTIVMKGLEKNRARRYASAREMADDLDRWLQGEPIAARPVSALARLARRAMRHKGVVSALAGLLLVAVVGAIALMAQGSRASKNMALAQVDRLASEARLKLLAALWLDVLERRTDLQQQRVPLEKAKVEFDRSVEAVARFAVEHPALPQGWYIVARGEFYRGRLDESEAAAQKAIAADPAFRLAWLQIGMVSLWRTRELSLRIREEATVQITSEQSAQMKKAVDAFARAPGKGQVRDESTRWGLPPTIEDEVMERLAVALARAYIAGDVAGACADLERAIADRTATEYLTWRAILATTIDDRQTWCDQAVRASPGDPFARLVRGSNEVSAQKYQEALADFDHLLRIDERSIPALVDRSLCRTELGDPAGALADAQAATRLDPRNPFALNNRGALLLRAHRADDALADFEEALRLLPTFVSALSNRGSAQLELGHPEQAMIDLDEAIRIDPQVFTAHLNRGIACRKLGDLRGAIASYTEAIRLHPNSAVAYYDRAISWRMGGDLTRAMADFNEAIRISPRFLSALIDRGKLRRDLHDLDGAMRDYDEVLRLAPTNTMALTNRGNALRVKGDLKAAIADFDESLRLDPTQANAFAGRATAKRMSGDLDGALADASEAIRLDPHLSLGYNARSLVRRLTGNLAGAAEDADEAIRLDPKSAAYYTARGMIRMSQNSAEGAIRDFDQAIAIDPGNVDAWTNRGIVWRYQKETAKARADFQHALELTPPGSSARAHITKLLRELGD